MSKSSMKIEDTGERMVPEHHKGSLIYAEHITRYTAAKSLVENKIVLDIASGSGYGTKMLSEVAKKVYGIDADKNTVAYSKIHFSAGNIEYRVGDGESIPLEDSSIDVIVTFETIEHIPNYKKFLREINRVLKNDGIVIVSTPNDLEFAEGNHFHLHEFKYKELFNLLKKQYQYIDPYYQATWKYVGLGEPSVFNNEGLVDISNINLAPLKDNQYLYFYLVCSNKKIAKKIKAQGAMGEHYSDRQMQALHQEKEEIFRVLQETQASHDNISKQLVALNQELMNIKDSKAYKTGLRLRSIKQKVSPK